MITAGIWVFIGLVVVLIFLSLVMKIFSLIINLKVIAFGALVVFLWKKFKK